MNNRKWLKRVLVGGALLFLASFAFSRALRASAARRYLTAHLAASFGRPVEVSYFDFSLLDGARIEAHYVSVADDPHFGNEYFLRSDTLTAGLRWSALLAGRFEFGAVSLSRASLNLARGADGQWNIERWLPPAAQSGARPGFVGPLPVSREVRAARPVRIEISGGRINFKQGDDKSPFALVDVSGRVEQTGAGRWQLDLEARPLRAGVGLQDIGTLRLRGSIAGTSARLQPAELNLTWRAASIADTLRLIRESDFGMRGQLDLDLTARVASGGSSSNPGAESAGAQWSISGVARLTGMHGWRLPARDSDPAANLSIDADWRLGEPRAQVRRLVVEMPASRLEGGGDVEWSRGIRPQLHIQSSTVALNDVLSWYRALRPDIPEDLRADCSFGVDLKLAGWPIELQQGIVQSRGGTLAGKSLAGTVKIGVIHAAIAHGGIDIAPSSVSFAAAATRPGADDSEAAGGGPNSFSFSGSIAPRSDGKLHWPPDGSFAVEGSTLRIEDWLALSSALGQPLNPGWTATGGLAVKVRTMRRVDAPAGPWLGAMDFLELALSPAYVNQPVHLSRAHVEFTPAQRTITVASAEAFGASWRGSLTRKYSDQQWTFDLSADHLDTAELDRWLGPRARPGFLARLTGSSSAPASPPVSDAIVTRLAAHGHLHAGAIDMAPLRIDQFDGEAEIAGRALHVRKAQGGLFGGKVSGSLEAQLVQVPSYEFQGRLDRVDLGQLAAAVPFLGGRVGGTASAFLTLAARGIGRQDLVASLTGQGTLSGRNTSLAGFHLASAFPGGASDTVDPAPDSFGAIQGAFRIGDKSVDVAGLVLDSSRGRLAVDGRIDFSHALNLRIHPSIYQAATLPASVSPPDFLLGGTIEAPKLAAPPVGLKPVRPNSR